MTIQYNAEFHLVCSCQSTFTLSLVFHRSIFQCGSFLKRHLHIDSPAECLILLEHLQTLGHSAVAVLQVNCVQICVGDSQDLALILTQVFIRQHMKRNIFMAGSRQVFVFFSNYRESYHKYTSFSEAWTHPASLFFFILSSENTKEQHLGFRYDGENVVLLQAVYCCSGTANVACRRKNCTNCN